MLLIIVFVRTIMWPWVKTEHVSINPLTSH